MSKRLTKTTRKVSPPTLDDSISSIKNATEQPELLKTTKTRIRQNRGDKEIARKSETVVKTATKSNCAVYSFTYEETPQAIEADSPDKSKQIHSAVTNSNRSAQSRRSAKNVATTSKDSLLQTKKYFGIAYIFNQVTFDDKTIGERFGSNEDASKLEKTLESFNIKVYTITDPDIKTIQTLIKGIAEQDYSESECLIITVLSHGESKGEIYAKDGTYNLHEELVHPILCCETLIDKPKIYFVQACKGGLQLGSKFKADGILTANDVLIFYSTFEGFTSYRNPPDIQTDNRKTNIKLEPGSLFINSLCKILDECGDKIDFRTITDRVIEDVKQQFKYKFQIPSVEGTFTRRDFVLPKRH